MSVIRAGTTRIPYQAGRRDGETLLDDIEQRFRLMGEGPSPLAIDGLVVGHGLPARPIVLTELSAILMHPSCGYPARDAVWRLLVRRARRDAPWRAGAVGVALPGLRFKAYLLTKLSTGDVQAAIVENFLRAVRTVDVDRPGVIGKLLAAAFSGARAQLRDTEPGCSGQPAPAGGSTRPPAPYGHPDLVLARAVAAGVITVAEADLIGATFLEDVSLAEYALRLGQPRWRVYRSRHAAVARLAAALRDGSLHDLAADAGMTAVPEPAPSRRLRP